MGIPILLDYSWFIIFIILTFQLAQLGYQEYGPQLGGIVMRYFLSGATAILLFVSILLHELGHSFVALRKGIVIRSITLFIFGGVAETTEEPRTATEEFEIAAAGPLVSVAIAAVAWSLITLNPLLGIPVWLYFILYYIAEVNITVVLFNMIPGFPLDGGRIFRAILWKFTGNLRTSTHVASNMGKWVGYFMIFVGFILVFKGYINGLFLILIGFFLVQAAKSSYQQLLIRSALSGVKVQEVMSSPVTSVYSWFTLDELINDYFLRYRYSSFPVMDDGILKGYVTMHDAKEIPRMEWMKKRVLDILRPVEQGCVVTEDVDAVEALTKMIRSDNHKLIVTQDGTAVGIVTLRDLMALFKMKTDLGS